MVGVGYITHCSPYSLSHSCGMLDFLEPLKSTIQQQCAQFFSWVESIFPDHGTSISPPTALPSEVEKVMVKVMLGVQQVMAHHKEQLKSNKKQEEEGSDQSDILLCKTLHEVSLRNVYNMKTSDVSGPLSTLSLQ